MSTTGNKCVAPLLSKRMYADGVDWGVWYFNDDISLCVANTETSEQMLVVAYFIIE